MLIPCKQSGVTLIELMIGIVIVSLLMVIGAPSFSLWIQNTQTRTAAESIQNGLQIARTEAVRRNANVRFNLTDAGGKVAWTVCLNVAASPCATADTVQSRSGSEGGVNARAGVSLAALPSPIPAGHFNTALAAGAGLPAGVTFDGMGRVPALNPDGTANNDDITRVDVTNAANAGVRRMVIIIGTGGQTRMCDPALTLATNPQGCS